MTKKELAELFCFSISMINRMFKFAEKVDTLDGRNIKAKNGHSTKIKVIDYTYNECELALGFLPHYTPMMKMLLKENFIKRDSNYYEKKNTKPSLKRPARLFLYLWEQSKHNRKVCASCIYITARKPNHPQWNFMPYCKLYSVFLNKCRPPRNIYQDCCTSYEKTDKFPLIFQKNGAIFNPNTTPVQANFTTGRTKRGEDIVLVNTIENTKVER